MSTATRVHAGDLLREWRRRRNLSQLELALEAGVSARHLSFVETGRARPSRGLLLRLAGHLQVPLREQNALLLAAGYAPAYPQRGLDDPAMLPVRQTLDRLLAAHEPYPALAVDGFHDIVALNRGAALLTEGVAPELLQPPANALRIALHPKGMAPRIVNLAEWSLHLLEGLRRRVQMTGNARLAALLRELTGYPCLAANEPDAPPDPAAAIAVPLRLRLRDTEVVLFSTLTTFGAPFDITLAELALEAFYPADPASAESLRRIV